VYSLTLVTIEEVKCFSRSTSYFLPLFQSNELRVLNVPITPHLYTSRGFALRHPVWFPQPPVVVSTASSTSITATITTATPTVPSSPIATKEEGSVQERRPSWRLRVDNGDRSKVCPIVCAYTHCLPCLGSLRHLQQLVPCILLLV
jgi:hypothetical protein